MSWDKYEKLDYENISSKFSLSYIESALRIDLHWGAIKILSGTPLTGDLTTIPSASSLPLSIRVDGHKIKLDIVRLCRS